MIYKQSRLKIVDNSGVTSIRVFQIEKYSISQCYGQSGDLVLGSILKYKVNKKVQRKKICKVLIVTSKKLSFRVNGMGIRFDENRGVLTDDLTLVGTRVFGPISREVRKGVYRKVIFSTKQLV
jgi:large subunit ribosomal protein L14